MNTSAPNIQSLFQTANQEGAISGKSLCALSIPDMGQQIQPALGICVDDVTASEVVLVTLLIDDSGSIRFAKNSDAVRDGHNLILDALDGSKQKDAVLMHTRYLNGEILYPYSALTSACRMDSGNYNPVGGTPLYDEAAVILGTVIAKAQEFADNGVPCRTVTLIVTDGADQHSQRQDATSVKTIVTDLLRAETHIVAGMGIDDGCTDFNQVFRSMGIPDEWILTPGNSPSEIRKAMQVFSQSAIRASQSAHSFSQTAAGGFGSP